MKKDWIHQKLKLIVVSAYGNIEYIQTGENLKQLRLKLGVSRKDLDSLIGCQSSCHIENASIPFTLNRVIKYLDSLYCLAEEQKNKLTRELSIF